MTTILQDADLARLPAMSIALRALEAAFAARLRGELVSPPRHHVSFPPYGDLVFTVGGAGGPRSVAGFRVYDTFGDSDQSQVVAVWSTDRARLEGIVIGTLLGEIRTGAIGGMAIRYMSPPDARVLGMIGTGRQARTQLQAAAAVRQLQLVRVYSRSDDRCRAFAAEMEGLIGTPVQSVSSARQAVDAADIVICATTSPTPVVDARWLKQGVHVNTVGPKSQGDHEVGLDVAEQAATIATDSPEQVRGYSKTFFLDGTPSGARVVDLALIVGGGVAARKTASETTLFCSTGLAGTEVIVAAEMIAAHKAMTTTASSR